MQDTLFILVQRLLKSNRIAFDKDELAFQIQSHPSYPSLHAITGVLDHFNIENVAADVPVNKETLVQLPDCFLVQINTDKGKDLVIVERKQLDYVVYNSDNKKEKHTEEAFLQKFTGIIVAVEKTEESVQPEKKSEFAKYLAVGLLIGLTGFTLYQNTINLYTLAFLLLSVVGVITSIAIVKQELGLKTSIGNAFCSGADDKKDCDAVLTSKGAEIIKGYKLSDLSVLYFSGLALLTLAQISNPAISYTISLLAIPVTLYSIHYQYVVVKKWCMLCLSIVGILWLQAATPLITHTFVTEFEPTNFVVFGIVSSITWLAWYYIKPLVTEVTDLRKEKIENIKFKRNYTLFESLLKKSPQLNTQIQNSQEIVFGNPNSTLELTIVTNPFCGHCKPIHKHIDEILHRYSNNVKIKIRFNINTDNTEDNAVKITSRLIELYHEKGSEACLKAMDTIYDGENPEKWLQTYGACTQKELYIVELEREKTWCINNSINFTPEILVNGRSFPKEYNRTDLIFFIEDLEENTQELVVIQ
ncbi:vitamin K epoxide reductase family protein [Tenacibaculum aiptasiae]|uniref:vitamin K epoxide reductase family protein n=1 Tax=Tenacibaculum aiptasiae TaxID=426481 RepID=UPI003B5C0E2C